VDRRNAPVGGVGRGGCLLCFIRGWRGGLLLLRLAGKIMRVRAGCSKESARHPTTKKLPYPSVNSFIVDKKVPLPLKKEVWTQNRSAITGTSYLRSLWSRVTALAAGGNSSRFPV
jgi:hypothetical protein